MVEDINDEINQWMCATPEERRALSTSLINNINRERRILRAWTKIGINFGFNKEV